MISIIVPVYNCEKTIDRCIKSILNQTYKDLELILVDDGSTDGSGKICDLYAGEDDRIQCIHKVNGGVSSARNTGLERARGEFIQFIDSDDYIEKDMCEKLLDAIGDDDWVICGYNMISADQSELILPGDNRSGIKGIDEAIPNLFSRWLINSPWNKLYKRELIKKEFSTAYYLGEDLLFNLEYAKGVSSFACVNKCLYNYISDSSGSLTKQRKPDFLKNVQACYICSMEFYNSFCSREQTKKDIAEIYVNNFIDYIRSSNDKKNIADAICDEVTIEAFGNYAPPSAMQKIFKSLILSKKVALVKGYVSLKDKLKG